MLLSLFNAVVVIAQTDLGLVVRPKRYRAVLMDQDVLHRVSAPSAAAGGRPRYSLVWKLVRSVAAPFGFPTPLT